VTATIIDASALSAYLLDEEGTSYNAKIGQLLIEGTCATELVLTEGCNAILTALRRKRISDEGARNALEVLLSFYDSNIKVYKQDEALLRSAYQIAQEFGIAIYDALYIVLAKKLGGSLASIDPKQVEVAKKSGVKVISLAAT